jgi:hypothetical protein
MTKNTGISFRRPYRKPVGFIPNFRGEANFLRTVLTHPCAQPWFLLVETFIPAILKFYWTTTIPQWDDLAIDAGRDLANRGRTGRFAHGTRRPIPVDEFKGERKAQKLLRWLLIAEAPLESIGFWWLVTSATDEFFFDWASLLQERDFCSREISSGPFQRSDPTLALDFNVNHPSFPIANLDQNRAGWANDSLSVTVPDGIYTVILSFSAHRTVAGQLTNCAARIHVSAGAQSFDVDSDFQTIPGGGESVDFIATASFIAHNITQTITWQTYTPDHLIGICTGTEGRVIVTRDA